MSSKTVGDAITAFGLVVTVEADRTLAAAVALMKARGLQHLVVKDEGRVVGVLSLADVFERGCDPNPAHGIVLRIDMTVADVMTPLPQGIDDGESVEEALMTMARHRCTALPVMHRDGLVGLVTKAHLMHVLAHPDGTRETLEEAGRKGMVGLANPLVQQAMFLLSEAGI